MSLVRSEPDPIDLVIDEFLTRHRRGERPAVEEFAARYPEQADRIRGLFPDLLALEAVGSVFRSPDAAEAPIGPGTLLGEYRLLREVGRGGMGVVYEALQESLGRRVAVKVLAVGPREPAAFLDRFHREARTAARLHHTNIVPVYGVGTDKGVSFYAMQFIQGRSLADVLDAARKKRAGSTVVASAEGSTVPQESGESYYRQVAGLLAQAADAVAHAHAHGVLHRDLKPSNLLVDESGTLWVADFGLAKADDSEDLTHTGDLVGTLRYMAPERFHGEADARSDGYALGATLYEMLALRPAFDAVDRPHLIEQVTSGLAPPLRTIDPSIPIDLETIARKAMAADPRDRYDTAAALADDLRRYLDGRPVLARRPTLAQRGLKWARRNSALVAVTGVAAVVAAIVSITILAVSNAAIAAKQRETQKALDGESAALANEQVAFADSQKKLRRSLIDEAAALRASRQPGQRIKSLALLREAAKLESSAELRDHVIATLLLPDCELVEPQPANPDLFRPDFFLYLQQGVQGKRAVLRRTSDRSVVEEIPYSPITSLRPRSFISPSGRYVLLADSSGPVLWDRTQSKAVPLPPLAALTVFDWTADESCLVLYGKDGRVHVHDVGRESIRVSWSPGGTVGSLAIHPNGTHVLVGSTTGAPKLTLHALADGRVIASLPAMGFTSELVWSKSGRWLAANGSGASAYLWSWNDRLAPQYLGPVSMGRSRVVSLVGFSPSERLLLINDADRELGLVAMDSLTIVSRFAPSRMAGHQAQEQSYLGARRPGCDFSSDEQWIGWNAQAQVRLIASREFLALPLSVSPPSFAFSAEGDLCLMSTIKSANTEVLAWDLAANRVTSRLTLPHSNSLFANPNGSVPEYVRSSNEVRLHTPIVQGGVLEPQARTTTLIRLPAGKSMNLGIREMRARHLYYWPQVNLVASDWITPKGAFPGLMAESNNVSGPRGGEKRAPRVAPSDLHPNLTVWPPNAPEQERTLEVGYISRFALDPAGKVLATQQADEDRIKIWDFPSGRLVRSLDSTDSDILEFSPDGRYLVQYGNSVIGLWRTDTWQQVFLDRRGQLGQGNMFAFSPDTKHYAYADGRGILIRRLTDHAVCLQWANTVRLGRMAFSPNGRWLVATSVANDAWAWDLDLIRRQLREMNLDWSDDLPER